jgi:flagellar biosynthesis/type III secretory pathway protein FliH
MLNWSYGATLDYEQLVSDLGDSYDTKTVQNIDNLVNQCYDKYFTDKKAEEEKSAILAKAQKEAEAIKEAAREETKKNIENSCKEGEFGKDEEARYLEELQALVNEANKSLEEVYGKKEKDILGE